MNDAVTTNRSAVRPTESHLLFRYCPKLAVVDGPDVLLCRRAGEADLDGVFTFIGGKLEHSDASIIEGLRREKTEEIGPDARVAVLGSYSIHVEFTKADGGCVILPHFLADWQGGTIELSDEYSEHRWVPRGELSDMTGVVPDVADICSRLDRLRSIATPDDWVTI
jgi:ADP-ribose pyrophosphatase YjhB (NUDIX family)